MVCLLKMCNGWVSCSTKKQGQNCHCECQSEFTTVAFYFKGTFGVRYFGLYLGILNPLTIFCDDNIFLICQTVCQSVSPHLFPSPHTHFWSEQLSEENCQRFLLCFPCCRSLNSTSAGSSTGFSQNNSEINYPIVNYFKQINQPFFKLHITLSVNGQCNHINKECWRTDWGSSNFSGFIYKVPIINMTGVPTFTVLGQFLISSLDGEELFVGNGMPAVWVLHLSMNTL